MGLFSLLSFIRMNEKMCLIFFSISMTPRREGWGVIIRTYECVSLPASDSQQRLEDGNNGKAHQVCRAAERNSSSLKQTLFLLIVSDST